jgi:hypothetical protein
MTETKPTDSNLGESPELKDRSSRPAGILPKKMQSWAILGIALVMILVISLSGGKTPQEASDAPAKAPSVIDPNESRILEYRSRIEDTGRKLEHLEKQLRSPQSISEELTQKIRGEE